MKKIFGIRHHGPGSARSLQKALVAYEPDCLLIEGPPDANDMIPLITHKDMKPPVALLVYNPDAVVGQSAFYPFASFSPEWIAMQYANEQQLPVRFMDLPLAIVWKDSQLKRALTKKEEGNNKEENTEDNEETKPTVKVIKKSEEQLEKEFINRSPIAYLAKLANYEDPEQWWENTIEQKTNEEDNFEAITEMMGALREELEEVQTEETLLREAYMRRIIREAEKEGFQKIAIVCGAWHAPALENFPPKKEDDALLKGKRKTKTAFTWIPWTYERLSRASGYGAGITSPAWYEAVFEKPDDQLVVWWMSRVAHLFRDSGQDASPAHVLEACRLAYSLAALRGRHLPVLNDFLESVKTIFCFGDETPLKFIEKKLVVGEKMGSIPDDIPQLPLQTEVLKLKKKYRLKDTSHREPLKIDLREPAGIAKSQFLHRLNLLDINYGKITHQGGSKGTFNEFWHLDWQPEMELSIIEAATYGNTIETASTAYVRKKLSLDQNLLGLANLLEKTFLADLPMLIYEVTAQLQTQAAQSKDVLHFMQTLPRLIGLMRYSDVRQRDTERVEKVVRAIFPRMVIGLPTACANIAPDLADNTFNAILFFNNSVKLINDPDYLNDWLTALEKIAQSSQTHRKIAAGCARILFETGHWQVEQLDKNLSLALSPANKALDAAAYVEGFLHGNALLLIHNESLFSILDRWVDALKDDTFVELLPLLRRSFAHFSFPERKQLGKLAKDGTNQTSKTKNQSETINFNPENVQKILPTLRLLLG